MSVVQSGSLSVPVALDMVNRVQRECGVEQITSMASGNDRSEVVREALNDSIIDLYNRARWEWLQETYFIPLVAGVDSYQLPQNFDRLAMPVRLTNTPMKEYTPLDWPYYIPTVDPGGQGGPHSYMVKNQVLSVFPAPTSDTVTTNPQFVLAYYKHPGVRIPASAAGDAMTWDVPPEFVEPLITFGKWKLKLYLEYPDSQADMGRYEQLIQQNMNKRRSALQNPQMHQRFDPTKTGGSGWNFWG